MSAIRTPWRVRTIVPVTAPRRRQFAGFTTEKIRAGRHGIDRGLYIVRTPDGRSRVAIVRGIQTGNDLQPHLVYQIRDGFELGTELAAFWPGERYLPPITNARHAIGDFRDTIQFACQAAQGLLSALTTSHFEPNHD